MQIHHASPIGAANIPRFAYKRQMPRSVNNISCRSYIALILLGLRRSYWGYVARTASPNLPELAFYSVNTDRKRKKGKNKMEEAI
jgi:hypothetical protein